ncbi:peptidoglycan-binding domain-containing protein [Trichormus variabilis]|uniref:Peptidoglycan binding-like domain-containing protein n=1 Tax=Trichormus variabilis SAG 1403-4b TaxID=447716 RepID=A0A433UTH9_ANAVA|nr:peptidoglycan-binding domain-containing protein [Trichormus variabilis]MBD2627780.1 peptidoglycan-binding protein [Trichormus variabilis FACHB-164]RUS97151.1 hypothetical protein DSM107003_18920 [Trichormus variabilis SAG 1403-4b]
MAEHPHGVWIWNLSKIGSDYLDKLVKQQARRVYLKVFDGKRDQVLNPTFWDWQCSSQILQDFQSRGMQVYGWGYHYGTNDVDQQVAKVKQAIDCGLDGYVIDLEKEVENRSTHPDVEELLQKLRSLVAPGTFGYTSFGNPALHPDVPWKILDKYCDLAFPQIYFEKWTTKRTEEEVKDCFDAHRKLGLTKLILPIWGSEDETSTKYNLKLASVEELQNYLNNAPGSSIWRVPENAERAETWKLKYSGFELPILERILRNGIQGDDVKALQKALNARGFNAGTADGDFGDKTEVAVRAFQTTARITVDGEVAQQTWTALGGEFEDQGNDDPNDDNSSAQLVKYGDLLGTEKSNIENGFYFPPTFGNRFANLAISSNPKRWQGEPGQRARYLQDADMPIVANSNNRSAEQIRQVIDYLNVADNSNKRYARTPTETYCNIFVRDVMRCLRAPLPHWVGTREQGANEMHDWLSKPANNWLKVTADEASNKASQGIPALVCWKNPSGIGHIAVVRPERGTPNNPRIAQAGSKNFKNGLVTDGFGTRSVSYFTYKG